MAVRIGGASTGGLKLPSAQTQQNTYSPAAQTEGYLQRLQGVGVNPQEALDTRNGLEKLLNLTKDQNALLDVFEVINRPQQAIFGAIEASQKGEDIGKAFMKGLKGEDLTQFKDILHNAGVKDTGKDFGFDDVAGFIGDIFLDPVDYAFIPVKAAVSAGKLITNTADFAKFLSKAENVDLVLKATDGLGDVAKTGEDIAKIVDDMNKVVKRINAGDITATSKEAMDATRKYNLVHDALTKVDLGKKWTTTSPIKAAFSGAKKAGGVGVELIDKGLDKATKALDALNSSTSKFNEAYTGAKNFVTEIFNIDKLLPDSIRSAIYKEAGLKQLSIQELSTRYNKVEKIVGDLAKKTGKNADEINGSVANIIEFLGRVDKKLLDEDSIKILDDLGLKYGNETAQKTIKNVVDDVVQGGANKIPAKTYNDIKKAFTRFRSKIKNVTGAEFDTLFRKVDSGLGKGKVVYEIADPKALKAFLEMPEFADIVGTAVRSDTFYTKADLAEFLPLLKDKEFMDVLKETSDLNASMQKVIEAFQSSAKLAKMTPSDYVRHVYNKNLSKADKLGLKKEVQSVTEKVTGSLFTGDVKAVQARKWNMSIREANNFFRNEMKKTIAKLTKDGTLSEKQLKFLNESMTEGLFIESLTASMHDWMKKIPDLVQHANVIDEVLVDSFVARGSKFDPAIHIMSVGKSLDSIAKDAPEAVKNMVELGVKDTLKKMKGLAQVTDSPGLQKLIKTLEKTSSNGKVYINRHALSMLGFLGDQKQAGAIMNIVDKMNNMFKKTKLLSGGFHVRNVMGNSTNMMLAGMPPQQIPIYFKKASNILKQGEELAAKVASGVKLTDPEDIKKWNLYKHFFDEGFGNVATELYDMADDIAGSTAQFHKLQKGGKEKLDYLLALNNKANEFMDNRFRMALLMYASDNPKIIADMGFDPLAGGAASLVRTALFDPKALSAIEKNTVKKFIPFYTFMKKNLAYQSSNVFKNPQRYNRLIKAIDGTWEMAGIDPTEIEGYKRENFWIPVPGLTKDGEYTAIKSNLPIGDLGEFVDSPFRKILSALTPAVRAPFELATNKQIFTERPISDFKGQEGYNFPWMSRQAEYLFGATGFDVPTKGVQNVIENIGSLVQGQGVTTKEIAPSVFSEGSLEKAQLARDYEDLNVVQDLMSYYKQELGSVPTIAELENKNTNYIRISGQLESLLK